ncbi:MAG: hypothetical protein KME16_06155 [Scytolyngbya sp. HA4215-MV1]|jgi:DnaJ-class molecular chaperone|nr:hypothetical protein [Scytolyngbya sp. HA4215-MV1]
MIQQNLPLSGSVQVQCAYCQGKGRDRFGVMSPQSTCQACHGTGTHWVTLPLIDCVYCRKTGISPTGTRNPCLACGGKAVQSQANRSFSCPRCGGTGTNQANGLYCYLCHGSGLVDSAS